MFLPMQEQHIYYEDIGKGPVVLLIHGLGGSTRYWHRTRLALEQKGMRVICFDLPGFGRSDLPLRRLNVCDYTKVVDYVITALNLGTVSIVGCSMGGLIAWMYSAAYPKKVLKTVLVNPVGIPSGFNRQLGKLGRKTTSVPSPAYLHLPGLGAVIRFCAQICFTKILAYPFMYMAFAHPAQVSDETFHIMRTSAKEMRVMHKGLLIWRGPEDPVKLSRSIESPTLIVWGAHDRLLPRAGPGYYLQQLPKAKFILYPHAGHVPMLEIPEQFNSDLVEFLKGE